MPKTIFEFEIAYNEKCEEGYPFYKWIVSDTLPLQKIDGGYWQMGKPLVLGSALWHNNVFDHILQLSPGEKYSCKDLELSQFVLEEFSGISILKGPLLYKHFNKRHLIPVWQVEDKRANSLSLNVNASEGDWSGVGDFFIGQILGYPRELLLHFEKYSDVQGYSLMYKEPWVFGYPLGVRFNLGIESVDSVSFWLGSVIQLEGEMGHSFKWEVGLDGEIERWINEAYNLNYLERWGVPWALVFLDKYDYAYLSLKLYGGYLSNFIPNEKVVSYREWGGLFYLKQSFRNFDFYQKVGHEFIDSPPKKISPNEGFDPRHDDWSPRGLPVFRVRALNQSLLSLEAHYLLEKVIIGVFHDFYHANFARSYYLYSYGPSFFTRSDGSEVDWSLYLAWTYQMVDVLEGRIGFRIKYLF